MLACADAQVTPHTPLGAGCFAIDASGIPDSNARSEVPATVELLDGPQAGGVRPGPSSSDTTFWRVHRLRRWKLAAGDSTRGVGDSTIVMMANAFGGTTLRLVAVGILVRGVASTSDDVAFSPDVRRAITGVRIPCGAAPPL